MSDPQYTIDYSGEVARSLLVLLERAKALGILNEFYDAGVWIRSELTRSPLEFGEARYSEFIPNQLMLRCATVRPLHVEFVVHEASKNVFIRRYALVKL